MSLTNPFVLSSETGDGGFEPPCKGSARRHPSIIRTDASLLRLRRRGRHAHRGQRSVRRLTSRVSRVLHYNAHHLLTRTRNSGFPNTSSRNAPTNRSAARRRATSCRRVSTGGGATGGSTSCIGHIPYSQSPLCLWTSSAVTGGGASNALPVVHPIGRSPCGPNPVPLKAARADFACVLPRAPKATSTA